MPQSRRRVLIVGYLDPRCAGKVLPFRDTNENTLMCLINHRQDTRVYDPAGLSKTLLAKAGGPGGKTGLYAVCQHTSQPNAGSTQGVMSPCRRIRRLMPRECFRLQGFSEDQIDGFLSVDSETQAYTQAGNTVTVNVVHTLALRLKAAHEAVIAGQNAT